MKAYAVKDRTNALLLRTVQPTADESLQAARKWLLGVGYTGSDIPKLDLKTVVVDVIVRRKKK